MANIASQKKRILRTERERLENRRYTSSLKTQLRQLEAAVKAGDADEISAAQRKYTSLVGKAVKAGALHRNTGSRKIARASRMAKAATAA
ncbi:30S ribosomal protein S20 [Patulibacter sp.]|uniref:30S ribosomal protein S20 n=1 Tax=Patulibacter sp. TaxID=1912859 RepID=UPI0027276FAD|nr:30S ribosomal protein S20 [Patulibacter sp.]MDO9407172.1 30S ribosomal protein S20 [Patulibacter sp.]